MDEILGVGYELKKCAHRGPRIGTSPDLAPGVANDLRDVVAPRFANVRTTQVAHGGHWPHVEQLAAVAHLLTRFLTALAPRMSRPVPNTYHTERLGK